MFQRLRRTDWRCGLCIVVEVYMQKRPSTALLGLGTSEKSARSTRPPVAPLGTKMVISNYKSRSHPPQQRQDKLIISL